MLIFIYELQDHLIILSTDSEKNCILSVAQISSRQTIISYLMWSTCFQLHRLRIHILHCFYSLVAYDRIILFTADPLINTRNQLIQPGISSKSFFILSTSSQITHQFCWVLYKTLFHFWQNFMSVSIQKPYFKLTSHHLNYVAYNLVINQKNCLHHLIEKTFRETKTPCSFNCRIDVTFGGIKITEFSVLLFNQSTEECGDAFLISRKHSYFYLNVANTF